MNEITNALYTEIDRLRARVEELKAENKRLRETLRNFVTTADTVADYVNTGLLDDVIRQAREALKEASHEG